MKVLFQRRELRVMTALLSRPRRGHLIFTHIAPLPQDCQWRREHRVTAVFPCFWSQKHIKYSNIKQKNRSWWCGITRVVNFLSSKRENVPSLSLVLSAALLVLLVLGALMQRRKSTSVYYIYLSFFMWLHQCRSVNVKRSTSFTPYLQLQKADMQAEWPHHLIVMFPLTIFRGLTSSLGVHSMWSTPVELIFIR